MMSPNDNPRHIEECWNVTIIVNFLLAMFEYVFPVSTIVKQCIKLHRVQILS